MQALQSEEDGDYSVAVGYQALYTQNSDSAGQDTLNTAVGAQAGANLTTAIKNTLIGSQAGGGATLTGDNNVAVGYEAGKATTSGGNNTAVGSYAGDAISSAADNTAVGYAALSTCATGIRNTAIGRYALNAHTGNDGTAVGYGALELATGAGNTSVGKGAGRLIVGGANNTMLGHMAGDALTTGSNNIMIGYQPEVSAVDAANQIVIGDDISSGGDNTFRFGKASNVVTNTFTSDANWAQASDERLKTNINAAPLGLDFVNDLRPVTYQWKASQDLDSSDPQLEDLYNPDENLKDTDVVMHGLVAQEVKEALDTAGVDTFAGWSEDSDGVQNISREMFVIPLIKAVQELSATVETLQAEIELLKGE